MVNALKKETIPNRTHNARFHAVFIKSSGYSKWRMPALLTAQMQPKYSDQNTNVKLI